MNEFQIALVVAPIAAILAIAIAFIAKPAPLDTSWIEN